MRQMHKVTNCAWSRAARIESSTALCNSLACLIGDCRTLHHSEVSHVPKKDADTTIYCTSTWSRTLFLPPPIVTIRENYKREPMERPRLSIDDTSCKLYGETRSSEEVYKINSRSREGAKQYVTIWGNQTCSKSPPTAIGARVSPWELSS